MEIIGKSIPYLQSAISSGLDSVATGIQEMAKVGAAAIDKAWDSFSPMQIEAAGAADFTPVVADAAQFPDPLSYFQTNGQSSPSMESKFVPAKFVGVLKDQNFNATSELMLVSQNSLFDGLANHIAINPEYLQPKPETGIPPGNDSPGTVFNEFWKNVEKHERRLSAELKGSADVNESIKSASEMSKLSEIEIQGSVNQTDAIKGILEGPHGISPDLIDKFPPLKPPKDPEPPRITGQSDSLAKLEDTIEKAKPTYAPKEPEYLEGSPTIQKPDAGSASAADQRGIIIVGGKDDIASDRGIIIVGGKTEGTYLETIDDTLAELNRNPQPETVQLFQNQLGALQDMSSTINQTVQMNQQLSSAALSAKIRL